MITEQMKDWIAQQKIFFVATAPLSAEGHINCSPKGLNSFRVLDDKTCVYQDLTGSGVETIAHVKENKRIVIMFCAFDGTPKIMRLHGHAEIIEPNNNEFSVYQELFPLRFDTRAFILIHVTRAKDSCGYSIPKYEFIEDRDVLDKWSEKKGYDGILAYQQNNNLTSLDGLKGLKDKR